MFKKLLSKTFFVLALTAMALNANAALITQDIISDADGVIGSITINTVPSEDEGFGFKSVLVFESFTLFGYDLVNADPSANEFGDLFFAEYDSFDLLAGIQFLQFDLNDNFAAPFTWAYSGILIAGVGGEVDAFNITPASFVGFLGDISFGQASVVPEPSMFLLLVAGLMSIAVRRRKL